MADIVITDASMSGDDLVVTFNGGSAPSGWSFTGNYELRAEPGDTTSAASPPTVSAGADASHQTGSAFTRTATENDNGAAITARAWTILAGPTGVGTTIGTAAALSWNPTVVGTYTLRYSATNAEGTGTDDVVITVSAPPSNPTFDGLTHLHNAGYAGSTSITTPSMAFGTGAALIVVHSYGASGVAVDNPEISGLTPIFDDGYGASDRFRITLFKVNNKGTGTLTVSYGTAPTALSIAVVRIDVTNGVGIILGSPAATAAQNLGPMTISMGTQSEAEGAVCFWSKSSSIDSTVNTSTGWAEASDVVSQTTRRSVVHQAESPQTSANITWTVVEGGWAAGVAVHVGME